MTSNRVGCWWVDSRLYDLGKLICYPFYLLTLILLKRFNENKTLYSNKNSNKRKPNINRRDENYDDGENNEIGEMDESQRLLTNKSDNFKTQSR